MEIEVNAYGFSLQPSSKKTSWSIISQKSLANNLEDFLISKT